MPNGIAYPAIKTQPAAKSTRIKSVDLRSLGCFKRRMIPLNPHASMTGISAIQKFIIRSKNDEDGAINPASKYALVTTI